MKTYDPSVTIQEEFTQKIQDDNRTDKLMQFAPILVLIGLVIAFVLICGVTFISPGNLVNLMNQLALPLVVALGLTFVIMLGSIDLSIDGTVGMAGSVFACLVMNTQNGNNFGFAGVLIAVLLSTVCGMLIGLCHVYLRIPSFMASFSFMYVCRGIGMLSYQGHPPTITDPLFAGLSKANLAGIPFVTWIALLMFVICYVIQEYTPFGRHIYAVGTNEAIPKAVGVSVQKVKVKVFTLAGFLFGVAGVLGAIRLGQGQIAIGTGKMFPAQAAVVVGGTALCGGKGGVRNTLVGVLIMTVLDNGLTMVGINPNIRTGIQGVIILLSVVLTAARGAKVISK